MQKVRLKNILLGLFIFFLLLALFMVGYHLYSKKEAEREFKRIDIARNISVYGSTRPISFSLELDRNKILSDGIFRLEFVDESLNKVRLLAKAELELSKEGK